MVIIFIIPPPIQQLVYDLMLPVSYKWKLQETVPNISQIIQWAKRLINNSSKIGSKVQPSKDAAAMRKAYFCKPPNNGSSSLSLSACSFMGTTRSACYENQEFCAKKVILPFFPLFPSAHVLLSMKEKNEWKGKNKKWHFYAICSLRSGLCFIHDFIYFFPWPHSLSLFHTVDS